MQDYVSSGFAPALSSNFAPNPYDQPIHMLGRQAVLPKPTGRREFISQQERKIRADFLSKTTQKSMPILAKSSTGTHSKREMVNANLGISALHLKLVASAVAVGLILFAGQVGCSYLSQQLAANAHVQPSSARPALVTSSNTTAACVKSSPTTPVGTTTAPISSAPTRLAAAADPMGVDTHDIDDIIAVYKAATLSTTTKPAQAIQSLSVPSLDVNLSKISTADLVKIGYEKLRTGSAKESISVLSEAVKRDRNDPVSRRYLGYALVQMGRPSEALAQYDALQKLSGLLPADRLAMQHAMRIAQTKSEST